MRSLLPATAVVLTAFGLAAGQKPETATFETSDGVRIVADYYAAPTPPATQPTVKPPRAPIAILLHMYPSDRSSWRPLVGLLNKAGIAALALDIRGHGDSTRPASKRLVEKRKAGDTAHYTAAVKDVLAAYTWLSAHKRNEIDFTRFGVVGASIGCSIAMKYAATDRSVDTVVCLSPGTDYFDVDSLADIEKIGRRPILLAAASREERACRELARKNPAATVKIYPQRGRSRRALHGTNLFRLSTVKPYVVSFLTEHLGHPADQPVVASIHQEAFHPLGARAVEAIKLENLRWFSSAEEATARGLRPSKRDSVAPEPQ